MPTPRTRPPALTAGPPAAENLIAALARPQITLDLQTVTPVVGGGVEPFEPDATEPVRVPGVRGQLREWWRRLYSRDGEDADSLFAREAKLWGGVGTGEGEAGSAGAGGEEGPGLRSRVVIRLDPSALRPGNVAPAGSHPPDGQGRPKAMPDWEGGRALGYGLFPLQRTDAERQGQRGPLATKSVRKSLSFRLVVSLRPGPRPLSESEQRESLRQVLAALWVWIHLGGLGARTRRGFGALELKTVAKLEGFPPGCEDLATEWTSLLAPSGNLEFEDLFIRFEGAAGASNPFWPPLLYSGQDFAMAAQAHETLLAALQFFRQGAGFARDPGTPSPGRTRWPEANLLRVHRDPAANWEHPIPDDVKANPDGVCAPRAAFGLPIVMQFKSDRQARARGLRPDSDAKGQILPEGFERWASPLLLRPVRSPQGRYRPLVIVLGSRVPGNVRIRYEGETQNGATGIRVPCTGGARPDILTRLAAAGGRAIEAFTAWLTSARGFHRIAGKPAAAGGGGGHA